MIKSRVHFRCIEGCNVREVRLVRIAASLRAIVGCGPTTVVEFQVRSGETHRGYIPSKRELYCISGFGKAVSI